MEQDFKKINWEEQAAEDEATLQNLLSQTQGPGAQSDNLFDADRPLDLGEKADDAQDFEDISDDDLPEEEEGPSSRERDEVPGLTDDVGASFSDDDDDLFGPSSPIREHDDFEPNGVASQPYLNGGLTLPSPEPEVDLRLLNFPEEASNQDPSIPAAAESLEELVKQAWPTYNKGAILDFNSLLPPKNAFFIPKAPVKPPKPVNPTKVSLDLAQDQEKSFRVAGPATSDKRKRIVEAEAKGLVAIVEESEDEEDAYDAFDYTPIDPKEKVGGLTLMDLEIVCADWETRIDAIPKRPIEEVEEEEPLDEWEKEFLGHSAKRKKVTHEEKDEFIMAPRYPIPNFDNFEEMTAQLAKRPIIDLNDPHILVEVREADSNAKRRRLGYGGNFKRVGNETFASSLSHRFNISNDEAYDALKENHQSKVRATLGNLSVEHSMPALKLQWPYYRVKLYTREARSFHRPSLKFNKFLNQPIQFSKPRYLKKKMVKGLSTQEIFQKTGDLSLADHYASATLLEYSEEHPTVLSNFGMGNRIINYYRRKDAEDTERPQPEDKIGDTTILLPEDRSPFSNFGMVDPGETVRTLHNSMYRAPIFKHEPKNTDFLVIRKSTGMAGTEWHMRNIDSIFAVGQQFPSIEIPGPHSRKVTNAAKNRMKMIAFRKIRHSPQQTLKIGEITEHILETTDMQNRQKLKEFIHYDKTEKVWRMRPGEQVPDEATVRAMVKPEEVCVIDAMQVGLRHLEDAGYAAGADDVDDDAEGQNLEQNLAPWKTSKAFLEASADKAMLQLHGEGDPSGCGMAFSFIKTSMKGGYIEALQQGTNTTSAAMSAARMAMDPKKNGGHGYNVKAQQGLYNEAIRTIWDKQKENLSDPVEHEENDHEREQADDESHNQTPHSIATPAEVDDDASQYSINSRQGKVMRITRQLRNKYGQVDSVTEIIKDPRVWREYMKRRRAIDSEKLK